MVDSYFATLRKKNAKVPPIREANPEKSKNKSNITTIIAIHPGILFFPSHEIGGIETMLMKSASKMGAIITFAKIIPAKIIIKAASFITGDPSMS